jgi:hypothetical protein
MMIRIIGEITVDAGSEFLEIHQEQNEQNGPSSIADADDDDVRNDIIDRLKRKYDSKQR